MTITELVASTEYLTAFIAMLMTYHPQVPSGQFHDLVLNALNFNPDMAALKAFGIISLTDHMYQICNSGMNRVGIMEFIMPIYDQLHAEYYNKQGEVCQALGSI